MAMNDLFVQAARKGAELGGQGKMCPGCAFRPGTEANNDEDFIEQAAIAIAHGCKFQCHMKDSECIGYRYAKRYMDSVE